MSQFPVGCFPVLNKALSSPVCPRRDLVIVVPSVLDLAKLLLLATFLCILWNHLPAVSSSHCFCHISLVSCLINDLMDVTRLPEIVYIYIWWISNKTDSCLIQMSSSACGCAALIIRGPSTTCRNAVVFGRIIIFVFFIFIFIFSFSAKTLCISETIKVKFATLGNMCVARPILLGHVPQYISAVPQYKSQLSYSNQPE